MRSRSCCLLIQGKPTSARRNDAAKVGLVHEQQRLPQRGGVNIDVLEQGTFLWGTNPGSVKGSKNQSTKKRVLQLHTKRRTRNRACDTCTLETLDPCAGMRICEAPCAGADHSKWVILDRVEPSRQDFRLCSGSPRCAVKADTKTNTAQRSSTRPPKRSGAASKYVCGASCT